MKKIIVDSNNIANIAYHRAKSVLLLEKKAKLKGLEGEVKEAASLKANEKISKTLTSFSTKIYFNILHKYIKDNKDYKFYIVWDGRGGSNWRKEAVKTYKSNRDHSKDNFYKNFIESVEWEKQLLENYPVIQMGFDKVEADDIIYNLCNIFTKDELMIISGDGDMTQLIQKFDNVSVWNPRTKKFIVPPEYDLVLFKAISGDSSDAIEGLYKYGPKKTEKAIKENLVNLNEEQLEIIENNKLIIDLALNPNCKNNEQFVIKHLRDNKINMNHDRIKKMFFDFKLAEFMKKWTIIYDLLLHLEEVSLNGAEKESKTNQLRS